MERIRYSGRVEPTRPPFGTRAIERLASAGVDIETVFTVAFGAVIAAFSAFAGGRHPRLWLLIILTFVFLIALCMGTTRVFYGREGRLRRWAATQGVCLIILCIAALTGLAIRFLLGLAR
jgi:hypothetical protein